MAQAKRTRSALIRSMEDDRMQPCHRKSRELLLIRLPSSCSALLMTELTIQANPKG